MVRLQAWWRRVLFAGATHLPLTVRAPTCCVNTRLTRAGAFRVKENVVPTGGSLRLRASTANALPSRQTRLDSARLVRAGGVVISGPPGWSLRAVVRVGTVGRVGTASNSGVAPAALPRRGSPYRFSMAARVP